MNRIINYSDDDESFLTYETLTELWETFVEQAFDPAETNAMFKEAGSLALIQAPHRCISQEALQQFMRKKIMTKEGQHHLQQSKEGVICFERFFLLCNQISEGLWVERIDSQNPTFVVKVHPEKLEWFETLWSFVVYCEDENAIEEAMSFMIKIYSSLEDQFETDLPQIRHEYIARCFEYLKEANASAPQQLRRKKYLRGLRLISMMMDDSERNGLGDMKTHSQFTKSEQLEIHIDYKEMGSKSRYIYVDEKKLRSITVTVDSNITFFELLKKIGQQLRLPWDKIDLFKYPSYLLRNSDSRDMKIRHIYNGRTLTDLGINTHKYLRVYQGQIRSFDALRSHNAFSPRAEKFLMSVFDQYSDNGKMSPQQCCDYLTSHYEYPIIIEHTQVKDIFESADSDRDNYLTLDEFMKYYLRVSQDDPYAVFSLLFNLGKKDGLRERAEVDSYKVNERSLASNIISSDNVFFNTLLSLLDDEEIIAEETWKLLNRMPTNIKIFEEIVSMTDVRGIADLSKRDWNSVINMNSKYSALYALNIIEYLIFFDHFQEKGRLIEAPKSLLEYQKTWEKDFIEHGGLEHLCAVFKLFRPTEKNVFKPQYKRVLQFAKVMSQKFGSDVLSYDQNMRDQVSMFVKMSSEYQDLYLSLEQTAIENLVKKAVQKFRRIHL